MKKIISLFLAFAMMISLTACGREPAEDAVNNALTAVKELKVTKIYKYFELELPEDFDAKEYLEQMKDKETVEKVKLFTNHFTYNIIEVTEAEDNAFAKVEMTNIDMKLFMTEYVAKIVAFGLSESFKPANERLSEEESNRKMMEMFITMLQREDIKLTTNTVDVVLVDVDGKWKIHNTEEVLDGVTGGLVTIAKNLEKTESFFNAT